MTEGDYPDCWCISDGGMTCGNQRNGTCYPDHCFLASSCGTKKSNGYFNEYDQGIGRGRQPYFDDYNKIIACN